MRLRVGVLGCARIVEAALIDPARRGQHIEVIAIASRSPDRARKFAAAHNIARVFDDYQALIEASGIDAVYIPLPNSMHGAWTRKALAAGKAVLCEKPITANASEAEAVAAASEGRLLMEAFHYRYHPMALFLANFISSGALGPLTELSARFEIPGRLLRADDIRFDFALGGGALMDVGAYCVDALRWLGGTAPKVVSAEAHLVGADVDGAMRAEFSLPESVSARLECSLIADRLLSEVRLAGERGWLRAENPFLPHLGNRVELCIDGVTSARRFSREPSYLFQAQAFAAAARGDKGANKTPAQEGLLNMGVIDATYRKAGMAPRSAAA